MNSTDGEFIERLAFGAVRSGTAFIPTTNVQKEGLFFSVVEFTGAAPLFRFVQSWTAVPDSPEQDEKILSALSGGFDQVNTAFVQGKGISGIGQGSGGSIDIVENSPKKVVLDVNAEEQTLMVRSSKYHPAWKVYIDGKPADLLRANYLFQGLLVPQGKHRILFQLEASNKGLIVSSAGRILMLIGLIFSAIRWRKKNHR